jgi:hypothetical protein
MTKDLSKKPNRVASGTNVLRLVTLAGVVAVLVISFLTWQMVGRIQTRLDARLAQIETRLSQVAVKVDTMTAQAKPAPRGPDPNRVYTVNTSGAPVKGPAGAMITIAEFSDFQ